MTDRPTSQADASLDALIQAILDDPGYANGVRKDERGLSEAEALSVLEAFYEAHDAADEKIPLVAARLGRTVACTFGCNACCGSLVLASTPEARLIARELRKPEHAELRKRFLARADEWVRAAGERSTRAADAHAAGNAKRYMRLMKEHARQAVLCPLNEDGACAVYAVRPLPCRQGWAADTPDYCMPTDDPDQPEVELISYDAFDALIEQGRQLTSGMQHVMGQGIRRVPLVLALLEVLDEE